MESSKKKNIQGFIVIAKSSEFNPTHDPPIITFLKIWWLWSLNEDYGCSGS